MGIPQWLEHQIRDQKVPSLSSSRSGFFFFFFLQSLRINSCWFLSVFTAAHTCVHTQTHRVRLTYAHPRTKTQINALICAGTCTHTHKLRRTSYTYTLHRHGIIGFKRIRFMCMYGFLCARVCASIHHRPVWGRLSRSVTILMILWPIHNFLAALLPPVKITIQLSGLQVGPSMYT